MGLYSSIEVSASGLSAERLAMDVIANNIANVNTTRTPQGGPFKRQLVVFAQKEQPTPASGIPGNFGIPVPPFDNNPAKSTDGVEAVGIISANGPDRLVYDPTNPDADRNGYVHMPNIQVVKEMVDMIAASQAYQANVTAIQETRTMGAATMSILKA